MTGPGRGSYATTPHPQTAVTMGHWRSEANCRDTDPDAFFPDPTDRAGARYVIDRYCAHCPVQAPCLTDGSPLGIGIWGGAQLNAVNRVNRPRRDFTLDQMRAANAAYSRHKYGGGPEPTDDQMDAWRAYQRTRDRDRKAAKRAAAQAVEAVDIDQEEAS